MKCRPVSVVEKAENVTVVAFKLFHLAEICTLTSAF